MLVKLHLEIGEPSFSDYIEQKMRFCDEKLSINIGNDCSPIIAFNSMYDWLRHMLESQQDVGTKIMEAKRLKEALKEETEELNNELSEKRNEIYRLQEQVAKLKCQLDGAVRAAGGDIPSSEGVS